MKIFLSTTFLFLFSIGSSFAQSVGDFRTRQTGNWSDSNTWEEVTSIGPVVWTNTANTPTSANGVITVNNGNLVTIQSGITIVADQLSVEGELYINGTLDILDGADTDLFISEDDGLGGGFPGLVNVENGGWLINRGVTTTSDVSLIVKNGGTLEHRQTSGAIPVASFQTGSTCLVSQFTAKPSNLNQIFHHLTLAGSSMSATLQLNGDLQNINGDFNITSTNGNTLIFSNFPGSVNIGGDLNISGNTRFAIGTGTYTLTVFGNVNLASINTGNFATLLTSTGNVTFNIFGNLNQGNVGLLNLASGSGTGTINLRGNLTITGGALRETSTGTGNLNINGGTIQSFNNLGAGISDLINVTVTNSSTFVLGENVLGGQGTFNLNAGSQLSTSNANTINNLGNGAIQTSGGQNYDAGSIISLTGSNVQFIDATSGFPSQSDLIINKTGGQVNLSNDFTLSTGRSLSLTAGILNIGSRTLTLNGTVSTAAGGLSGGSLSNLTIGGTGAFGTLGFTGTNSLNNFTVNRTSSGSVTLGADLTVEGTFTQTAGDLILNGNTLTLSGDYARTAGSMIPTATSSLVINGAGSLPATLPLSGTLQSITMNRASSTFNTGGFGVTVTNLNAYSGTINYTTGSFNIVDGGTVERRSAADFGAVLTSPGTFHLTYDLDTDISTGGELPTNVTTLGNLTKIGGAILTLSSGVTINGDLTLSNGTFNAGAQAIDLNGNFVANAASSVASSTFTFSGTTNLTGSNPVTFGDVTVASGSSFNPGTNLSINGDLVNNGTLTAGSGTATFGGTTTISGSAGVAFNNIDITGSLTAPSAQTLTVNGNFTNSGTFVANNGTVAFGNTSFIGTVPTFNNVQLNGTLEAPITLTVAGDFTNNGTFNNNNGLLDMTGTGTRTIGGSSPLALYTLNVSGGTVNNNNAAVNITDGVTIGASTTFDADGTGGSLTLLSTTSSQAAYIGQIPASSSVAGNVNVQRFFSTGRFYRYLGAPVVAATVADWQQEFPITGTFSDPSTGSYDGTTLNSSNPSLYYWDAAISEYVAYPTSGTAASNALEVGRGYSPFIRNSISNIIGEVTGVINQQAVPLPVAFDAAPPVELAGESWNLVANPYAAPIDWDAAGWTKTNIANEVHIPRTSGGYATYIGGVGANGGTQYIASGQAFWVRATAVSPTLSTSESIKSVGQNPTYFRTEPIEEFRILLAHKGLSDEIVIAFREAATFEFDENFDAVRRININGFGYTLSTTSNDGKNLKISSIPKVNNSACSFNMPLQLESVSKTGEFTMNFSQVANLDKYYDVSLFDAYLNKTVILNEDLSYTFNITSDAASKDKNRLSLVFNNEQASNAITVNADASLCANQAATVSLGALSTDSKYLLYNGDKLIQSISGETTATINILPEELNQAVNDFKIYVQKGACDSIFVQAVNIEVQEAINTDLAVTTTNVCASGLANVTIDNAQTGLTYSVYLDNVLLQSAEAVGASLQFELNASALVVGNNALSINIESPTCGSFTANNNYDIIVESVLTVNEIDNLASCSGESVMVQATTNREVTNYTLLYEGQVLDTNSSGFFDFKPVQDGTYQVLAEDPLGCSNAEEFFIINLINIDKPDISLVDGVLVTSIQADSYQWYLNSNPIEGATEPSFSPENPGVYQLSVNLNACSAVSDGFTVDQTVTANKELAIEKIDIYPNPVVDKLNISVDHENVKLFIYHINGQFMLSRELAKGDNQLDLNSLGKGVYLAKLVALDGSSNVYRLIKK